MSELTHDWDMPHDVRFDASSTDGCPPNCPAKQYKAGDKVRRINSYEDWAKWRAGLVGTLTHRVVPNQDVWHVALPSGDTVHWSEADFVPIRAKEASA